MWLKIVSRVHTKTTLYVLFLDLFTCVQHLYTQRIHSCYNNIINDIPTRFKCTRKETF